MNITMQELNNGHLLIILNGEMDALGCSKIRPDLEQVSQQEQPHIIIDINHINFIDSSGIGAIVFLFKRLKEQNRSMEIIGVQGQPQELMTLLRIASAIPLTIAPPLTSEVQHA
jgi:anti-anti-sigma factor